MSFHDKKGPAVTSGAPKETISTENHIAPANDRTGPLFILAAAGYDLIPIEGKAPVGKGWTSAAPLTAEVAAARLASGGNVGVRLRDTQVVVDWDPRDPEASPDGLDRFIVEFGLDTHPRVETGGGGVHLYLTVPAGLGVKNATKWRPGIDIKTVGGQVVAPGSIHPETGRPYVFHGDPLDDRVAQQAPSALIEALPKRAVAEAAHEAIGGTVTPDRLAQLLEPLNPEDFASDGAWLNLAMAAHHATGGAGEDVFIAWSLGDGLYANAEEKNRKRWRSMRPVPGSRPITIASIYKELNDRGVSHLVEPDFEGARDDFEGESVEPVKGALSERPEDVPPFVYDYNKRFCVAPLGKDTYVFRDTRADDHAQVWEPMTRSGFQELYRHDQIEVGTPEKPKKVPLPTLWLNHPGRRFAERVVFDPSRRRIDGALNTWRGWACKPKAGDWSLMQRVIREALAGGNPEYEGYILNWLAFGFQHPAELPMVALVFRGGKGVGKGTLGQTVHKIAGNHGLSVSGMSQVSGRFNAHLRQRVFVFADEVFASGNKEAESVLKRLITEPMLTFEAKGVDARNGPNYCKLILASNEHWVVPVSGDERRFAVFDVASVFQGDRKFWDDVHRQLETGGREAMLHDLLTRDIRGWHPTKVPQTDGLLDQKEMGLSSLDRWWFGMLNAGQFPSGAMWPEETTLMTSEGKAMLTDDYNLNRDRGEPEATKTGLARRLGAFGLDAQAFDGAKRAWAIKPLSQARADFTAAMGVKFDD